MAETTYKNKVYIPRAVRESLGLVDDDKLYIKVLDKAQLILIRRSEAGKRILERINNPQILVS
jgi:bifunctional DNA-binding transcriptional regulator/antitoxin component of YhaV-PrlF toxin-antitoxin module